MKFLIFFICLTLTFSACDLTSPKRFDDDLLVISGYLQAGKTIDMENPIFVGKTVGTEGGNAFNTIIADALVTIEDYSDNSLDTLSYIFDSSGVGYYNQNLLIQPGVTYKIAVSAVIDFDTLYAWAETTVPPDMYLDLDYYNLATENYGYANEYMEEQLPEIPYENVENDFPVYSRFDDSSVVHIYYNYLCLEEFSTSLEFTDPIFGYDHLEEDDQESYDSPLSNNMRESNMLWRYQPLQDSDGNWYLLENTYAGGFQYYGRYRITIFSVDKNFYTYKYHSEGYSNGGIQGGIGYFGSVNGEDFYTKIIK